MQGTGLVYLRHGRMVRASSDPPSEPRTGSFPDFMFRARRRTIVADAKYKPVLGRPQSRQMDISFSHTVILPL